MNTHLPLAPNGANPSTAAIAIEIAEAIIEALDQEADAARYFEVRQSPSFNDARTLVREIARRVIRNYERQLEAESATAESDLDAGGAK
jgi:hypothetical protein